MRRLSYCGLNISRKGVSMKFTKKISYSGWVLWSVLSLFVLLSLSVLSNVNKVVSTGSPIIAIAYAAGTFSEIPLDSSSAVVTYSSCSSGKIELKKRLCFDTTNTTAVACGNISNTCPSPGFQYAAGSGGEVAAGTLFEQNPAISLGSIWCKCPSKPSTSGMNGWYSAFCPNYSYLYATGGTVKCLSPPTPPNTGVSYSCPVNALNTFNGKCLSCKSGDVLNKNTNLCEHCNNGPVNTSRPFHYCN